MSLTIPNADIAIKAMADEDFTNWDQQCPEEHYRALLQAAWNTICISTNDIENSEPDIASLCKSKLFQKFLAQGFWHAHHVDLVWRYNGEDVREEADWLKDLWYAIRRTEEAAAPQADAWPHATQKISAQESNPVEIAEPAREAVLVDMLGSLAQSWREGRKTGTTDLMGHGLRQGKCLCADDLEALVAEYDKERRE